MTYQTTTGGGGRAKRQTTPLTWAVAAIALVALVGFIIYVMGRRQHAAEYNRIVEMVNEGRHKEAAPALEAFIPEAPDDMKAEARTLAARCYLEMGDDPSLPLDKSAEFYRKAQEHNPDLLNDMQKNTIKLAERRPD